MRDYASTIVSQYSSSPRLTQLISNINDYIDPDANIEQFYNLMWNIDTAQGYGLDVWGRIVGINRILTLSVGKNFGFAEMGTLDADPFGQSPFYIGAALTANYTLSDETYRNLIFAKAAANITDCSIPAINQILMNLFPNRGNAYVTEAQPSGQVSTFGFAEARDAVGFNQAPFGEARPSRPSAMQMTYVFEFALEPFEVAMVTSGVLPKPTGVLASYSYLTA